MSSATVTGRTAPSAAREPLRANRSFRLLWLGQALSDLGSGMTFVALPLVLLRDGYSTSVTGLIGTATLLTALAVRIPAGYLTDRLDPRLVMLGCDLARCALLAAVAGWTLLGRLPVALAVTAVVVGQVGLELFRPSQGITLRRALPADRLGAAAAVNQARAYAADIASPAAAALLMGVALGVPFAVDAFTFAASAGCVAALLRDRTLDRGPAAEAGPAAAPPPQERFVTRLSAGLRHVARDRFLRAVTVYFALLNLLFQILVYVVLLGIGRRHDGAALVGTAMSAAAVAGLAGALLTPTLRRWVDIRVLATAGPMLSALLLAAAWTTGNLVVIAASLCALCAMTPAIGAELASIMATTVPEEIYGRTMTASTFVGELFQPLGPLAAGLLLAALPLRSIAAAIAVALAVLAATGFLALISNPADAARPATPSGT